MRSGSLWSHALHADPAGGPRPQALMSQRQATLLCGQWGTVCQAASLPLPGSSEQGAQNSRGQFSRPSGAAVSQSMFGKMSPGSVNCFLLFSLKVLFGGRRKGSVAKSLAVLSEDLGWLPSTRIRWLAMAYSSIAVFSGLQGRVHDYGIHTGQQAHTQRITSLNQRLVICAYVPVCA